MNFSLFPRTMPLSAAARHSNHIQAVTAASSFRTAVLGALAVLGSAAPALALDSSSVTVKQPDASSLWLTIENPAHQALQMQVLRLDNRTCLANEVNHQTSYGCQLSFRNLPAGQYAVLVRVGTEHYRYTVQVQAPAQSQSSTISVEGLSTPVAKVAVVPAAL